jgi:phage/plasmid primase-like uncharacterized protein
VSAEVTARALDEHAYRSASGWWNTRCPVCGGAGKLGIKDDGHRRVVSCFKGCRYPDILAELNRLGAPDHDGDADFDRQIGDDPEQTRRRVIEQEVKRCQKLAKAKDIWLSSVSAYATGQIPNYLKGRGITVAIPDTIRLHGAGAPYGRHWISGERRPSMVGLIEHVERGIIGVTQTFLAIDGSMKATLKKPRLFSGETRGGAIRLGPAKPDEWLIVGEGIESTLSAMQIYGTSGWSALSANGIASLILPPEARKILICADRDENGVGERAARRAAGRWAREGRKVRLVLPPDNFSDFNDALTGGHFDQANNREQETIGNIAGPTLPAHRQPLHQNITVTFSSTRAKEFFLTQAHSFLETTE